MANQDRVANGSVADATNFYIDSFTGAFLDFMSLLGEEGNNYESSLVLDCANGVGAIPMQTISEKIREYV